MLGRVYNIRCRIIEDLSGTARQLDLCRFGRRRTYRLQLAWRLLLRPWIHPWLHNVSSEPVRCLYIRKDLAHPQIPSPWPLSPPLLCQLRPASSPGSSAGRLSKSTPSRTALIMSCQWRVPNRAEKFAARAGLPSARRKQPGRIPSGRGLYRREDIPRFPPFWPVRPPSLRSRPCLVA